MPLYTLTSHTNANAVRGSTLKDVERFRNGSVHELLAKSKFKRDSYEISNEQYEQNDKTINLTNFEAETNPSDVEKSKNLDKQNFKGETDNNIEVAILDETKDSRRNWKCLITVFLGNPENYRTMYGAVYVEIHQSRQNFIVLVLDIL